MPDPLLHQRWNRRKSLEQPCRIQGLDPVVASVDEGIVTGRRIHRQPRLDRIPAVVTLDQVVDLVEGPRGSSGLPRVPKRPCIVLVDLGKSTPRLG